MAQRSARFHRPDAGNGLNDAAKGAIKAARLLEEQVSYWELSPHIELLTERSSNEAYLAAKPGSGYALYFTNGRSVNLDLSDAPGSLSITWISVSMGIVTESAAALEYRHLDKTIEGGSVVSLTAPYKGGWIAALVKQ